MRKVSIQDFENLRFCVQMLSERVERFSPLALESVENMNRRIVRLENEVALDKRMLTSQEAADYLGVSREQLYQLIRTGKLPFVKPNRKMFFNKERLDEWVSENSHVIKGI